MSTFLGMPTGGDRPVLAHPTARRDFHLLVKPTGAVCNLDCQYCFFLSKEELYPGSEFRMADDLLEEYIRQLLESARSSVVQIAWQGGEPTMRGLGFFQRAMTLVERYRRPGQSFEHTIQTNGTLLTEDWAAFFSEHDVLVGISIDGPEHLHDIYRVNKAGRGTFGQVTRGLGHLKAAGVRWNALTTVHHANEEHGLEVYRFLRDDLEASFIQFIPIVELPTAGGIPYGEQVTSRSVSPAGWGRFLTEVFDEWVRHDVGEVFIRSFDSALAAWVGTGGSECVHAQTCGNALAMEHSGDVYSCDHFVEPQYLLGNIRDRHLLDLVSDPRQVAFGRAKRDTLPAYCRECAVRFACHGGCPKDRFTRAPDGQPGLHYLCPSYKQFFTHIDRPMRYMAAQLRVGGDADTVMQWIARRDRAGKTHSDHQTDTTP